VKAIISATVAVLIGVAALSLARPGHVDAATPAVTPTTSSSSSPTAVPLVALR